MRHIPHAHDEIKLQRKVMHELALVVCGYNMVSNGLLDVLDLVV
jgi:hypothetical protein